MASIAQWIVETEIIELENSVAILLLMRVLMKSLKKKKSFALAYFAEP